LINERKAAAAALHPLRLRILEHLREPDSAAGVARALSLPRQRVTYHVRALEKAGLVEGVSDRRKGNCVERVVRATARSYVIAPQALGEAGAGEGLEDQFSSSYLVAVAAQTMRDVAELRKRADEAGKRLPTLSLQTEVRFGSAREQHAFAEELSRAIAQLASKYHDGGTPSGRTFRFQLMGYPKPTTAADNGDEPGTGEGL
jgi:DNA-binding transcriptional ArsR family regulator